MKALVIGGSGSIGSAIVTRLLSEGYEVIVHYHQSDIAKLEERFRNQPVQFVQCDLTQTIDITQHFGFVQNLDCFIYCAGASMYQMLEDTSDDDIDVSYQLNVKQLIRFTRYFLPQLRQSEQGRMIVISSIWGETGASLETIYSTMKSAQLGFVKALSQELALTSVTVNAIAPGFVKGNMSDVFEAEELERIIADLPQQRLVEPEEVAHVCSYLCHPMAKSITGTVQKVNGAWYL